MFKAAWEMPVGPGNLQFWDHFPGGAGGRADTQGYEITAQGAEEPRFSNSAVLNRMVWPPAGIWQYLETL